jgi:hypothetical protein
VDPPSGDSVDGRHDRQWRQREPASTAAQPLLSSRLRFLEEYPFSKTTSAAESYSGMFKRISNCFDCIIGHLPTLFLEIDDCGEPQSSRACKIGLRDIQ